MAIEAEERYYLKLKAAYFYYEEDYTQQDIAGMLNISRPTLSKLLKEARAEGIVKIEINDIKNISHLLALEVQLKKKYKLQDVRVVDCVRDDSEEIRKRIGKAAAQYLEVILKSGMKIGMSWGKTLEAMVEGLKTDKSIKDLQVVTLVGGSGSLDSQIHANTLVQKMLDKYSGKGYYLYAPLIVENKELHDTLVMNKQISEVLEKGKNVDVAVVGIGGPVDYSTVLETGYFQQEQIDQLIKNNVAGDINSRFFDKNARICSPDLDQRIIGIDLQDLKKIRKVIATGGGSEKYGSIVSALKGRFFNILITDKFTAQHILKV